ncbi:MAG: C4-type zinc ribbon domain-containing protein [Candidatus Omnitrophica bacterium]|jgi:hypothetical protein|nr:C4-type zinc ribbon domain-containing protein [Candidatus Omnitrophota bacterium]
MPETDLKTQLGALIKLQALDTEIYALRNKLEAKPEEIKLLEAAFEEKKLTLASLEKTGLDLQKQKKDRELELASKEEGIKKLQGQLYSLKTNKEYSTMLQQIGDAKADVSVSEDKILQALDQMDKIKTDIEREKQKLAGEEGVLKSQKAKVAEELKVIDDRLAQLEAQRKQVSPGIDQKILAQYDRILVSRNALAIVTVNGNSCGGCNMFVPPQVINLIKMYDHIITCEMCNRILYIEEDQS